MNPERAESIDDAKRHAVSAKVKRDDLQDEFDKAKNLTSEEQADWFRRIGKADRQLQEYRTEIRDLYRSKGDDDES